MTGTILFTIACLVALGLLFAVVLYFVAQKFKVEEDPRIGIVESILPGANCGGCGQAGCHAFAENVVKAPGMDGFFCPVGGNPVGGNPVMAKVAEALGRAVEETAPMVAVVRCGGGATYVTNGMPQAIALAENGCHVMILGGDLKSSTEAVVGGVASYDDMLAAKVVRVSKAAAAKGVKPGMSGKEALLKMN